MSKRPRGVVQQAIPSAATRISAPVARLITRGWVQLVAEKQVRLASPDAQHPSSDEAGSQVGSFDEAEPAAFPGIAREERRDGEKELVGDAGGEESPEGMRACLGEDQAVPSLMKCAHDHVWVERGALPERDDGRGAR